MKHPRGYDVLSDKCDLSLQHDSLQDDPPLWQYKVSAAGHEHKHWRRFSFEATCVIHRYELEHVKSSVTETKAGSRTNVKLLKHICRSFPAT